MKKILFIVMLLVAIVSNAQTNNNRPKVRTGISAIKIKSIKPLLYESRTQGKDTIYIAIKRWAYDIQTSKYKAMISDYVKTPQGYKIINEKAKSFTKAEVDALFKTLNNSILPSENYSVEVDKLLNMALLLDIKNNLLFDGKTVYGGAATDWIISTE